MLRHDNNFCIDKKRCSLSSSEEADHSILFFYSSEV